MPRDRSADLLNDILAFIDRIESWTPPNPATEAGADEKTLYAMLHALQYIGEAVSRLPFEVTNLAPQVPWQKIKAKRRSCGRPWSTGCRSCASPLKAF